MVQHNTSVQVGCAKPWRYPWEEHYDWGGYISGQDRGMSWEVSDGQEDCSVGLVIGGSSYFGNDFSSPKVGGWELTELTQSREKARGAWRSTPSARHSSECPSHGLVHGYCELHMLTDALGLLVVLFLIWYRFDMILWVMCVYIYTDTHYKYIMILCICIVNIYL